MFYVDLDQQEIQKASINGTGIENILHCFDCKIIF